MNCNHEGHENNPKDTKKAHEEHEILFPMFCVCGGEGFGVRGQGAEVKTS